MQFASSGGPSRNQWRALLVFVFVLAATMSAQEVLTNETVVNMAKAHLGDKLIVDMIQSNAGKYVVTPAALIALKQQGVSDNAMAAMRAKMAQGADSAPAPKSKQPVPPKEVTALQRSGDGFWHVRPTKDGITGEMGFEAVLNDAPSNGRIGEFRVTATCSQDAVLFKVAYFSDPNPGYQLTNLRPSPKVVARVAIDGRVTSATSSVPQHLNEAQFLFAHQQSDEGRAFWDKLLKGSAGISVTDISPNELYAAKLIKMEMPLANGDLPILEIHPQDPGFQQFASRCKDAENSRLQKEEEQQDAAAAAAETRRQQAADEQLLTAFGVDRRTYDESSYGPPSLTDSYWNLFVKALLARNAKLTEYLKSLRQPIPYVSGVPGTTCGSIHLPGDILPGLLDWNAEKTQTVYARCRASFQFTKEITIGQVEIQPMGLIALKKKRAELVALGVSETPAPAEPDAPAGPLPPSWTTRSSWFVCPPNSLYNTDRTKNLGGPLPIRTATAASILDHGSGMFQVRLASVPTETYNASWRDLSEYCTSGAVRPERASSARIGAHSSTNTGLAALTILGGFPKPLTWGHYWLLRDDPATALNKGGVRLPAGMTPNEVMRASCEKNEAACKKITRALDDDGAAKVNADAAGKGTFPGVLPGTYYLMISAVYNNRLLLWNQEIELKAGVNSTVFTKTMQQR